VGTGFHPELSGRENILLNGAILGMSRAHIIRKFDEIVAFAEVEKFIDTAVKHYSSGMYLRLAFAVAAHLEPEILLVDEVLAVGDQTFQQKCLGKMGEVAGEGRTVLFVSHNLAAVRGLCTEALLLRAGQVAARGKPSEVINQYLARDESRGNDLRAVREREGDGAIRFTGISIIDHTGTVSDTVYCGETMTVELTYESKPEVQGSALVFHLYFRNNFGERLFTCSTRYTPKTPAQFPTSGKIRCVIDRLPLAPDSYSIDIAVKLRETLTDMVWDAKPFNVGEADFYGSGATPRAAAGPLLVDHRFEQIS
jgi:lipopolysaccharide transport system ATP-binding protein